MLPRFERVPRQPLGDRVIGLKNAIQDASQGKKVSTKEYKRRLSICQDCVYLKPTLLTCQACGCFIKLKAAVPSGECPLKKWSLSDSGIKSADEDKGSKNSN